MDYIVFDLEWNQSPNGKAFSVEGLPFEIIEIGAVRLSEDLTLLDSFQQLIHPQVYHRIHNSIHNVIHMDYKDLENGLPFQEAAAAFLRWCGTDYRFCTWGNQDLSELQRNLDYYHMLKALPGPLLYYNVQKLFAFSFDDVLSRRSLEYATDLLHLEKEEAFHRALSDARFTARILQKISPELIRTNPSLDVYQHPAERKQEIHMALPQYDKYVSVEFVSREKAMKDREVTSTRCPLCHNNAKRTLRWFTPNSRTYYSISRCKEHGDITGRIRFRKTVQDQYFVVKTLKIATAAESEAIRSKKKASRNSAGKKAAREPV